MLTMTVQRPPFAVGCPTCGSLGWVLGWKAAPGDHDDDHTEYDPCPTCKGAGYVIDKAARGKALAEAVAATTAMYNALGIN